ncbi:MAG: tetratricopeptide repeat protein [Verrucomicrobiota bacterium]
MKHLFSGLLLIGGFPLLAQHSFEQVNKLIEQGVEFDNNQQQPTKALASYQSALDILLKDYSDSTWHMGLVHCNMAYAYANNGDFSLAGANLKRGLEYYRKAGFTRSDSFVQGLQDLGVIYELTGNTTTALEYYQLAVDSAKVIFGDQPLQLVRFYNLAGYGQNTYGSAWKAIPLLKDAHRILLSADTLYYDWLWATTNNLGLGYHRMYNDGMLLYADSALHYYEQALIAAKQTFSPLDIKLAESYANVAGMLNNTMHTDESILYLDSAAQINKAVE